MVQKALLEMLLAEQPAALYPAALCALADLKEVSEAMAGWRGGL